MFILKLLSRFIGYKECKPGGVIPPHDTRQHSTDDEEEKRKEEYDRVMSIL